MEKFDPLTAGSQNVTRVHLSQVDFERTLPAFLDIHGYRQTVTRWSDAFKFTLGVANRVLHNSSKNRGKPGRSGPGWIADWRPMREIALTDELIPSMLWEDFSHENNFTWPTAMAATRRA